jgi:hypothetical protein
MWGTADGGQRTADSGRRVGVGVGVGVGKQRENGGWGRAPGAPLLTSAVGVSPAPWSSARLFHDRCLNLAVYEDLAAAVAGFCQCALGLLDQIGG